MNFLILSTGVIFGYLIATLCSGGKEGKQARFKSLTFKTKNYIIHLHHWFIASIGLAILIFFNFYNNFIYGLLVGVIIQGLTYKDFYRLIYRRQ
jgi:hypothetical protein